MKIEFVRVALTELSFKLNREFRIQEGSIPVDIDFKYERSFNPDGKTLTVLLTVSLCQNEQNCPFTMSVSVEGTFTGESPEELERFSRVHAPAHLFPFVREIVGNTTMRAGISPLLLPPFNLAAMLEEKEIK